MPRGIVSKVDIYARVISLKNKLDQGDWRPEWTRAEKMVAHATLNEVLDMINEYSQ